MRDRFVGLVAAGAVLAVSNLSADVVAQEPKPAAVPAPTKAVAVLTPTKGSTVHGVVTFTKVDNGVHVVADVEGLTPGVHAFHVHEFGDCSAADAASAGPHYNPEQMPHAGPDAMKRHEGDLGNITANENGKARYDRVDSHLALEGAHSIIGRSVIVHEKADDFTTQPTGAAGGRVACGVIGLSKE